MLVYIKPKSLFPKLHSDRIFGAILSAINEIYSADVIEKIIGDFKNNNPPFLISSAFPALTVDDGKLRFFPKVIINENLSQKINPDDIKDFKKVDYLEENIFFDIIKGKLSKNDILRNYEKYFRVKNLLLSKEFDGKFELTSSIVPHNSINRLSNKTEIFYSEGNVYGKNTELFFFIEILDESCEKIIESCLKFLKDRGFGRDISTGKGQFEYAIEYINMADLNSCEEFSAGDKFITLSRFIPSVENNELKFIDENSSYEIGFKRSTDKTGDIRKQVKFFKEGSTFLNYKKIYGSIVDVGNYKSAIEYGYAFPINFKTGDE